MPPPRPGTILQTILDGPQPALNTPLPTRTFEESALAESDLLSVFDHPRPLGISPGYSDSGRLLSLAIADDKNCRIIEFWQPPKAGRNRRPDNGRQPPISPPQQVLDARKTLEEKILCRPVGDIFAFDMGPLAMSLFCDLNVRIANATDVQSAFSAVDRKPLTAIEKTVGDTAQIKKENVRTLFLYPVYNHEDRNRATDLAMRAWISQFLPGYENGPELFEKVLKIDTSKMASERLTIIAKIASDSLRLDQKKSLQTTHQFQQSLDVSTEQVRLQSTNFKNRLRSDRRVKMQVTNGYGEFTVNAQIGGVVGRSGNVITDRALTTGNKQITTVTSIGRDDPTTAEAQRSATILRILQGSEKLLDESPWVQNIWFPQTDDGLLTWPKEWSAVKTNLVPNRPSKLHPSSQTGNMVHHTLNSSQQAAVNSMLSEIDDHRITLVQGPPGTGKTSVIASFVQLSVQLGRGGIWLVAQSNVAVKNIAEKLISRGFRDWKLLVSKDFHYEWHEHLYGKVENNIIRSDTFNIASNKANLQGIQVMLCTISMLSNFSISKFTREIPLKVLVVDEASQIEIGNYIAPFSNFKRTLRKVCFIGDDKQLPPHGQDDLQDLQSIFEVSHLKKHVVFLDTQYRMPPQIGNIISEAVYDEKLKSNPHHPVTDQMTACYFIDVPGKEAPLNGGSFKNQLECEMVLKIAQKLQEQEKNYRIITPYAGQTTLIENSMKEMELDWADKCFNVDSFQGNEDDFIIISVVRSRTLGFLNDLRRTNVMLSRCKKGMFIVSSQQFLGGVAAETLVGQFLKKMQPSVWLSAADIEGGDF